MIQNILSSHDDYPLPDPEELAEHITIELNLMVLTNQQLADITKEISKVEATHLEALNHLKMIALTFVINAIIIRRHSIRTHPAGMIHQPSVIFVERNSDERRMHKSRGDGLRSIRT